MPTEILQGRPRPRAGGACVISLRMRLRHAERSRIPPGRACYFCARPALFRRAEPARRARSVAGCPRPRPSLLSRAARPGFLRAKRFAGAGVCA
ncbi:unnamed protein product [Amoebophrya sp. A120]|nr:unnamed protein product [Amoebophrya sp. A120]|eukprot:GSA120T00023943001.1